MVRTPWTRVSHAVSGGCDRPGPTRSRPCPAGVRAISSTTCSAPRHLVAGEVRAAVRLERLEIGRGRRRSAAATTATTRWPNRSSGAPTHDRVGDARVALQHGLDLLGVHLLAAGVDAQRAAPEQVDGAVGVDGRHVAGQRPALAVDLDERPRAAARDPCGSRAAPGRASRAGRRRRVPARRAQVARRPRSSRPSPRTSATPTARHAARVVTATACAGDSDEPMPSTIASTDGSAPSSAVLHVARQDAAARAEQPQRRRVPPSGLRGERVEQRARARVADEVARVDAARVR